ncbi:MULTISPECIES: hypothetical protein [Micromonospora]|nr:MULTISPECIES: hypothetical protein [Micromonospora]
MSDEEQPGRRVPAWLLLVVVAGALVVCCCSTVIGLAVAGSAGLLGR